MLAIGQGTGAEAAEVAGEEKVQIPVLGDPGKASYRTLGLDRAGLYALLIAPLIENLIDGIATLRKASLRWCCRCIHAACHACCHASCHASAQVFLAMSS